MANQIRFASRVRRSHKICPMPQLDQLVSTADILLAMSVEDLGHVLLKVAKSQLQNGMFFPDAVVKVTSGVGMAAYPHLPFPGRQHEVEVALAEAWSWLRNQSLIVPAPDINGRNGYVMLSRRGSEIADHADVEHFRQAASFPKSLLHPTIADRVWSLLNRGDFAPAVLEAFRAVEEAVRSAGGYSASDYGIPMMRDAFNKTSGPLTDRSEPEAEREALAHLFAGAIGRYKNPHSHRTVTFSNPQEAREACVLATHLLRIVDSRRRP
jgi:uncharacterized protein (TIGR02391 family)